MDNKSLLNILNNIVEDVNTTQQPNTIKPQNPHERVIIIDGLNLFMRNFAVLNYLNKEGTHIGGLGGFLRSLGSLINTITPTSVYVVFDGVGSSINRKNMLPEYKEGRGSHRITNWESFDNIEEEIDSKVAQVGRLINYLDCLPIKTIALDKTEADDIIAYLSTTITQLNSNNKVYIVSVDKDFLQLASKNIIIYNSMSKKFWDEDAVFEKYKVLAKNFIIFKTFLGDNSDKIPGVKDLGEKTIPQKFPELTHVELNMDDIYEICKNKYKEHVIYSRIIMDFDKLKTCYEIMDLKNPLINDKQIEILDELIKSDVNQINIPLFIELWEKDGLGKVIRDVRLWLQTNFKYLYNFNNNL